MSAAKRNSTEFDSTQIEETVHDFEAFFAYLDAEKPKLTVKAGLLSNKDLFEINGRLVHQRAVGKPTYAQVSYPAIHAMFEVAQLAKLYEVGPIERSSALTLRRTAAMGAYEALNVYEKYVFLFEAFWTRFPFETDLRYDGRRALDGINRLMVQLASKQVGRPLEGGNALAGAHGDSWYSNLSKFTHYFGLFGFWTFVENKPAEGRKQLRIDENAILSITPTEWGVALSGALKACSIRRWREKTVGGEFDLYGDWLMRQGQAAVSGRTHEELVANLHRMFEKAMAEEPKELPPMVAFLAPLFPSGAVLRTIDAKAAAGTGMGMGMGTGLYEFKVALDRVTWRTIRISGEETLDALHQAIQYAFDFDDDHLYCFYMSPRRGARQSRESTIYSPRCEERRSADAVCLNELDLFVGRRFTYLFDFGAEWTFEVQVTRIERDLDGPARAEIIKEKGEAPRQYGGFWGSLDEEDEE